MSAGIEIQVPGKEMVTRRLTADQPTTVGRTAKGIAVPEARQLEREHFVVEPRLRGCHVMILPGAHNDATLKGRPFNDGLVGWGEVLLIGQVQVRFTQSAKGPSPIVMLGSVVIVGLLGYMLLQDKNARSLAEGMPEAPQLTFQAQACSETGPAARVRAEELEEQALASGERYAFDLTDGLDAARLFRQASACYAQAGDTQGAQRTEQSSAAWQSRLVDRYTAHRLRLRVALDRGQARVAQKQIGPLSRFVESFDNHPYRQWLAHVDHQLDQAMGR